MASEQQVKRYICYWFQLGKRIIMNNGALTLLPQRVIEGERYSQEFEKEADYIGMYILWRLERTDRQPVA